MASRHIIKIQSGPDELLVGNGSFYWIAGPCSIESLDQFSEVAVHVKNNGAHLLRGGIWKLRTSPKTFQGLGDSAFEIVKHVTRATSLGLTTEITDPRQVETLYPLISMYQVGSRNMHNYALLKELSLQDKPVLLKRGFAATVDEWLKAADYINQSNSPKVILCERGIRTFETSTRNTLDLNSAAFIRKNTPFPIIIDPSHGVGIRELVPNLALAATALGVDGIITEVHNNPSVALSDGPQALTLDDYSLLSSKVKKILSALEIPYHRSNCET